MAESGVVISTAFQVIQSASQLAGPGIQKCPGHPGQGDWYILVE